MAQIYISKMPLYWTFHYLEEAATDSKPNRLQWDKE